jgi:putative membrane protein
VAITSTPAPRVGRPLLMDLIQVLVGRGGTHHISKTQGPCGFRGLEVAARLAPATTREPSSPGRVIHSDFVELDMKPSHWAVLLAASVAPGLAMAQSPPAVTAPAPSPGVTAPAVIPGAPIPPLTEPDTQFVVTQTENNAAEFQAAQLALQHSRNQTVRDFAGKLMTDHTYAQNMLASIAQMHHLQVPMGLSEQHRQMLAQLAQLDGPAFDRAYVDSIVRAHTVVMAELNEQLVHGADQHISAWVQNTRPMVLQHSEIAQQLLASLPPTG